ncbi:MAG: pyrroloquinoline quinone biosynthesis peptide chaperone PqqD [Sterolibacteriaceae bacterium]|nr:pyrroloquinoline quinone biosynthesis peptide chaperone PqqD [Sterolibacteriaceae bacterium]
MRNRNQGAEIVSDFSTVGAATLDARPRVSKQFRLQWEDAQQSWVLLYPEGMVKLNASAGEIMKRCDGAATLQEIVADLERSFGADGLTKDVLGFIEVARKQRWIEV